MSKGRREKRGHLERAVLSTCLLCVLLFPYLADAKDYVYKATLLRGPAPIRIDGDLSDWEGLGARIEPIGNVCISAGRPLSPPSDSSDLSGSFRCVVDPENFYIAVKVRDDRLVFGEGKFGQAHEDDAVEVYFDGDLAPKEYKKGVCDYDANDAEVRFSKGKDGKVHLEGMGLFGDRLFMFPGLWESLGMEAAIKEHPWGYTAELKVPKIVFVAVPLRPGVEVGFQVMVNDDDDGGRRDSKISWTEDLNDESWYTTKYFGRLVIVK